MTKQNNSYQQELPSRMQKEVIKAADINNDGKVSVEELEILLKNIGAEHKFTHSEIEEIVSDMGSEDGETIHCDTMLKLLKGL
jgi:Ca2+-binding EF-hand superfamily protein